jgi:hypothetical protein
VDRVVADFGQPRQQDVDQVGKDARVKGFPVDRVAIYMVPAQAVEAEEAQVALAVMVPVEIIMVGSLVQVGTLV